MPALRQNLSKITDYPAYLEMCWEEHLMPRAKNAPTVISTFAGAGGSSLGYSMAGFRELLAVEWDDNAVETFKLNFPDVPVYHGDIAKLSVEQVLSMTGLEPGQLDVFDGSPPCQGFSTAGKRDFGDERNQLFREYARLLNGLQPKVFVMENVSGMVKGKMKLIFAEILQELKACGYKVSARLLNAMYFGVPQSRQRIIFVGVRGDLETEPSHPSAITSPIPLREAILNTVSFVETEAWMTNYAVGREWEDLSSGQKSSKYLSLVRPSLDKPCPTLTKDCHTNHAASVAHPTECRKFSSIEAKRIASFPSWFLHRGSYLDFGERIGNSVPPLFMRAIANHIRQNILKG